jgi:5'-phosphate synthase pdxT subunit
MRIGVLALQGGYDPHARTLACFPEVQVSLVRYQAELDSVDALILPGGESTTIGKLLVLQGLWEPLRKRISGGLPVFGTCAGMILLSRQILGSQQLVLGLLDISVERNAYGRQVESFEAEVEVSFSPERLNEKAPAVFIRAPRIIAVGPQVTVMAKHEGTPVLVREKNILAASFHPELTDSLEVHRYFLNQVC